MNRITIMGRLVADPELRHTQNGTAVCTARVAVDRSYKSQGVEKQADFFTIVAWRGTGETLAKFFVRGKPIIVDGSMECRQYDDRDGNKRYAWELKANKIEFVLMDSTRQDVGGGYQPPEPTFEELEDDDDGLPF